MSDFTLPFPPGVLEIYCRLQSTETPEEQAALMGDLAEELFETRDHFDLSLTEHDHRCFEAYEQAKMIFEQSAERLTRRVCRVIDMYLEENDLTWDKIGFSTVRATTN